ncbi:TetR family transcriptional regulator [Arthrobacter sp. JZ12]|uniref:TetR/AcrR family transcriptional regulator n=1 Tax=Arthrobacter sp. JZ12 TaxID=2654190 RepID=UPI002B4A9A49|nr:TetR/AcrR family transcriptional regulator [Arthrobacter sp. JZ12]WRH26226.1 TetR family transcriptional regulator [Arthrobacter sp. JZ12]
MASARERILDSFENILIEEGERSATMESVAAAAEVSKGGLLYHFRSKEALVDGLADRLQALVARDREAMAADPEGPARYYVRTSMYENSPLDRALVAMARLAQQGHPKAQGTFALIQEQWLGALEAELGSRAVARAVKLLGDGLYYDAAFFAGMASVRQSGKELQEVLAIVDLIVREGARAEG